MARKNDLQVSPAQEAEAAQQGLPARVESPSQTSDKDQADPGDNGKAFERLEYDDGWRKEKIDAGIRYGELDSDDAEDLAELINDASLSGANLPILKPADKASEGTLSRTYSFVAGLFASSSQKQVEFSGGNDSQISTSPKLGILLQVPAQGDPDNSAVLNGDKTGLSKSIARPNAIYEDISKMHKPRSSGRPDLYDVPQSPTRSPAPESKSSATRRRGPKLKRVLARGKPAQVATAVGDDHTSAEEELLEPQEHVEHAEKAPDGATRPIAAAKERTITSKRATRSTRAKDMELADFRRQREKYQRKAMKESQELEESFDATQPWSTSDKGQLKDQLAGIQAETSAAKLVEPNDHSQGNSRSKPDSNGRSSALGRSDTQPREHIEMTPIKRPDEVEKLSTQANAELEMQSVSPILSDPTPSKDIQKSFRRLQRPSQTLIPRVLQAHKENASSQQATKGHPVKSSVSAQIPVDAQDEASDEGDDIQHESDVSKASTITTLTHRPKEDVAASFIEEETLQFLRSTIKKAGRNAKDERVIRDDNIWTAIAATFTHRLTCLTSKYKGMHDLISADVVDVGKFDMEHQKALKWIEKIGESVEAVMSNRLGKPTLGGKNGDKVARSRMLEDLYLHVIPGLVEALYRALHSRRCWNTLEISDLEEFYALLKILHDLVKATKAENQSVQPRAPRANRYDMSKPTHRLWPVLQKLYQKCERQLTARRVAERADRHRQTTPERVRKRKARLEAEQRAEEEEFQQRLRDRNKAIIASLDERRAELGLPPCSQPIEAPSTSQRPQTPEDEGGPFDDVDRDGNRRLIGVFGRDNSHPGTTPEEWTKSEMEILVDGLRRERGPTRYEKLATRLERTLDEIFDRAKYLKMQIEYTLKRLQEENPDTEFPAIKPWIENIGSEGFLNQ